MVKHPEESARLVLDIGAGHRAIGNVNVDLYPDATFHRKNGNGDNITCDTKRIPNFVRADGQYLPFKSGVFSEVHSAHVLEHVAEPELMLREMMRVSNDKVTVTVPHRYGKYAKQPCHVNYFSNKWFEHFAQKCREVYSWTTRQEMRGFPLSMVPNQITFSLRVNHK